MNLLIAEDDPFHRTFLKNSVTVAMPECEKIFEASDGQAALDLVAGEQIDGIIGWHSFFHLTRAEQRSTLPRLDLRLGWASAKVSTSTRYLTQSVASTT